MRPYLSLFFLFSQYWGLNSGPTPLAIPPAPFCFFLVKGFFFEIGSLELFAWAGFNRNPADLFFLTG
jgi:hypothetical protein